MIIELRKQVKAYTHISFNYILISKLRLATIATNGIAISSSASMLHSFTYHEMFRNEMRLHRLHFLTRALRRLDQANSTPFRCSGPEPSCPPSVIAAPTIGVGEVPKTGMGSPEASAADGYTGMP
jgi:hypothetical protein